MKNLLAITIGQAPRNDMMEQMQPYLTNFNIIQRGALDNLSKKEIEDNLFPEKNHYVLESKLKNGEFVQFSEEKILDKIQNIITEEENNIDLILMLCTGEFNYKFETKHPIIYPEKLIHPIISNIIGSGQLAVLTPNKLQIPQSQLKWNKIAQNSKITNVSPYAKSAQEFQDALKFINDNNPDLIVMDCMGYTQEMKDFFVENTNKPVILSNVLIAKILSEY